ncbi:MAG: glycosyl hydrolase [Verrucomicrobia bacterium]|nr:glycosyl hydrolase [Verrucomicrobiota bacterium]
MKKLLASALLLAFIPGFSNATGAVELENGFAHPPAPTKPWCYWYWISDNISKDGITRDLEAMSRVGIGEALIGNIYLPDDVPPGPVKALTPEWWDCVRHAMREGGRTGVNIGMFNCPGWSQSGGPWIKPEQAMRRVVSSETRVTGPKNFAEILAAPAEQFQDIAVLAFPAPQADAESIAAKSPRVTCVPAVAGAEKLCDGSLATALEFPAGVIGSNKTFTVEITLVEPFTARSLQLHPTDEAFSADCELQAAGADGNFQTVRQFKFERSNTSLAVNCFARGPVTISLAPTTSERFRLVFASLTLGNREFKPCKTAALTEIVLSGAARLESFVEKQLGKMHPTDQPAGDTYLWPTQAEADSTPLAVPAGEVRNLSANLAADGTLAWDVPPGEWIILRTGMTPTGMRNSPASPEGQGLDVDKMNRAPLKFHFDSFIGEALKRIPAAERKAFKRVVADSYEMGSQNWTDGFDEVFRQRRGCRC